jgi:hypothetical protein
MKTTLFTAVVGIVIAFGTSSVMANNSTTKRWHPEECRVSQDELKAAKRELKQVRITKKNAGSAWTPAKEKQLKQITKDVNRLQFNLELHC